MIFKKNQNKLKKMFIKVNTNMSLFNLILKLALSISK